MTDLERLKLIEKNIRTDGRVHLVDMEIIVGCIINILEQKGLNKLEPSVIHTVYDLSVPGMIPWELGVRDKLEGKKWKVTLEEIK